MPSRGWAIFGMVMAVTYGAAAGWFLEEGQLAAAGAFAALSLLFAGATVVEFALVRIGEVIGARRGGGRR